MVAQNIMRPFVLYVLRCADGSYYVGHTDDLEKRIFQHETGELCGYTSRRRPVTLLYACEFATRAEALQRELQLKGWSRAKKEALIRERLVRAPQTLSPFDCARRFATSSAQGERCWDS